MGSEFTRKSHVATLGLAASLLGGCGTASAPARVADTLSEQVFAAEEAREKFLQSLYYAAYTGIMQRSSEELASIMEFMKYGWKGARSYDGNVPGTLLYIKGKYASSNFLEGSVTFNIDGPIRYLDDMRKQKIRPPSMEEIQDVFMQAIYSALSREKYKELEIDGYNVQEYMHSNLLGDLIKKNVLEAVTKIIQLCIPEIPRAIEDAKNYPQEPASRSAYSGIGR